MSKARFIPLQDYHSYSEEQMLQRADEFYQLMKCRRTVREFSDRPVPRKVIEKCLLTAGTAPSGANQQPWHFVVVTNPEIKHQLRLAAEKEEHEFYHGRASQQWLDALAYLGTDENKPFIETAPYLIAIMQKRFGIDDKGDKVKHYYTPESVGLATGMLITAIHNSGLVSLTHTPSPMGFMNEILGCSSRERPFLLLVVGYPKDKGVMVPDISKKMLADIATFMD